MRIIIDGRLWGSENAGLGRYVTNLVLELAKIDRRNKYVILLRKKYFNQLKLPKNWQPVLADFRHYSYAEQIKLPGIIAREKPDLTHFPHFNVPLFFRGPFVVTIHDMTMHKQKGLAATTLSAWEYYTKRFAYKYIFRQAVQKSLQIMVPAQAIKKELTNYYSLGRDKIEVTYEGVDKEVWSKAKSINVTEKYGIESPYFVYFGNAYPHKNLPRLLAAIKLLNSKGKPANLIISSARSVFMERLKNLIRDIKVEKFVKLFDALSDQDLASLLVYSVGLTYPSLFEGFGLPGLEAMTAGTLVLASDTPVFREVFQDNCLYFDPLSVVSIKGALLTALGMKKVTRAERIAKAKEFAKRYSWDKMARQTLKVYESSYSLRQGQ